MASPSEILALKVEENFNFVCTFLFIKITKPTIIKNTLIQKLIRSSTGKNNLKCYIENSVCLTTGLKVSRTVLLMGIFK